MKNLIHRCKKYLTDTLGAPADMSKLSKTGALPFFLHDHYEFYNLRILNNTYIVLAAKTDAPTPAGIRKHIQIVSDKLVSKAIFLCDAISSYNRKRLIKYKISFIVPGNQMYLPELAIDLKEHFIKAEEETVFFSPATNAVILCALNRHGVSAVTQKELAINLGYSKMTISRAVSEVESAGLAKTAHPGKNRVIQFENNRRNFWEKALPHMKTPVSKTLWVEALPSDMDVLLAGESALAEYSMLAPPEQPVYAMSGKDWNALQVTHPVKINRYPEEADAKLEIWRYNPRLLANEKTVDPFSLYLSLKETQDERVESALNKMMENIQW